MNDSDKNTYEEILKVYSSEFQPKFESTQIILDDIITHHGVLSEDTILALMEQISKHLCEMKDIFTKVLVMNR